MEAKSEIDAAARIALSPGEAARMIGIGRTTLYAEIGAGRLRSMKLGTRRLITAQAIQEWLAAREAEATSRIAADR